MVSAKSYLLSLDADMLRMPMVLLLHPVIKMDHCAAWRIQWKPRYAAWWNGCLGRVLHGRVDEWVGGIQMTRDYDLQIMPAFIENFFAFAGNWYTYYEWGSWNIGDGFPSPVEEERSSLEAAMHIARHIGWCMILANFCKFGILDPWLEICNRHPGSLCIKVRDVLFKAEPCLWPDSALPLEGHRLGCYDILLGGSAAVKETLTSSRPNT